MTLKEAVELQKEPLLQSLAESIRIRSVQEPPADGAPYGPNVRKCLDHALAVSKGLGFRTTDLDHQMGWCEFGEGDEMIAVLGHLDVVPEGEGWTDREHQCGGNLSQLLSGWEMHFFVEDFIYQ